jgi:hypothetical protein
MTQKKQQSTALFDKILDKHLVHQEPNALGVL